MSKHIYRMGGREELVTFLSRNPDRQFTTEELCLAVNGDSEHGKSSIYRHLTNLCKEETVRKFRNEERKCSVYQYIGERCDCSRHFHEKCLSCGKIYHLDCEDSIAFAAHLLQAHGFEIDCGQSILYGVCAECREGRRA